MTIIFSPEKRSFHAENEKTALIFPIK